MAVRIVRRPCIGLAAEVGLGGLARGKRERDNGIRAAACRGAQPAREPVAGIEMLKWMRKRFADEYALTWHSHAFPVCFDQRFSV